MSSNSFDQIAQALLKQKQTMEQLKQENRGLRQQLADLREGRGIFVEINGHRFALRTAPESTSTEEPVSVAAKAPTVEQSSLPVQEKEKAVVSPVQEENKKPVTVSTQNKAAKEPTFLEEIMLDTFASALTTPIDALTSQSKKLEPSEEEKKAALRRELMGSFLLE